MRKTLHFLKDHDKKEGGEPMQINNLSAPTLRPYGCVLDVRLEHATPVRQLQPQLDAPVEELCCTDAVLLDYAAGMSLLVIYTKEGCRVYWIMRKSSIRMYMANPCVADIGRCTGCVRHYGTTVFPGF